MHSFDLSVLFVAALFALSAVSESKEPWPQLCYWAKDRKAAREFIPCYVKDGKNELWPFQPCCMAGDVCLNYGACFNEKTNTTYHYGCNDKDYEALWCPRKCNLNLSKLCIQARRASLTIDRKELLDQSAVLSKE